MYSLQECVEDAIGEMDVALTEIVKLRNESDDPGATLAYTNCLDIINASRGRMESYYDDVEL